MESDNTERNEILRKLGAFRKESGHQDGEEDNENNEKDQEQRPEDDIPDLPENQSAREFLKNAPSKGLWLPMGVEVKVMQCWRCKAYGHRANDRECPLLLQGNVVLDSERQAREDPMCNFVAKKTEQRREKYERVRHLMAIMEEIREEEREREKKKEKKKHSKKSKKRKRQHRSHS
eukprot:CAMPEP_0182421780 /NCGR_PEP_ID=MMETSP1167-20130531/7274_1 /TAXON_ID=2988 /ORGANISM="Mallomonas Sp, Strain CCMP3275" /LENGTH=175 /DNA_ID=CAMNT_0024599253 /DNA_START=145 /DNA_END=672 /DNA_ORIENTATION=-